MRDLERNKTTHFCLGINEANQRLVEFCLKHNDVLHIEFRGEKSVNDSAGYGEVERNKILLPTPSLSCKDVVEEEFEKYRTNPESIEAIVLKVNEALLEQKKKLQDRINWLKAPAEAEEAK